MMKGAEKGEGFGVKLKKLREAKGLSLNDLAQQVRMKASYLKELESGRVLPHVSEIITLAQTLAVAPSTFMEKEPEPSVGKRKQALAVRTQDYAYETLTADRGGGHLMAFRVKIEPKSDHRKVGYQHEGEEFIYVLSGKLWIKVGRETWTLLPGQSLCFDSGKEHELKNPGSRPTLLLVVIYTP